MTFFYSSTDKEKTPLPEEYRVTRIRNWQGEPMLCGQNVTEGSPVEYHRYFWYLVMKNEEKQ
jgi:hypothetical protein